jgi:hypothetical protein
MSPPLRILVLLLVGAVLGTALDHLHVWGGVLAYATPALFAQAIWVPPLFAGAAVGLAEGYGHTATLLQTRPHPHSIARLVLTCGLFTCGYALTAAAPAQTALHDTVLLLVLVGGWLLYTHAVDGWSRAFVIHAIAAALMGTGVELLLTHLGAFHYLHPTLSTVAIWLPGLYLWGASVGRALHAALAPVTPPARVG